MIGKGTDEVVLTIISAGEGETSQKGQQGNQFWVQAGSFQTLTEAVSFQEQLRQHYSGMRLQTVHLPSGEWHRVQIGSFPSAQKAQRVVSELEQQFNIDPLLVQDN